MNRKENRMVKYLLCILCILLFSLAGYFFVFSPVGEETEDTWADSGSLKLGHSLTIQNTDNRLSLLDSKDVLSANGLYYASWAMGGLRPFVNSEGETVDLYDAQLYLVLEEHKSSDEARKTMTKWTDAAKGGYEVLAEEEILCNGQSYSLLTYNCVKEDNPFDRGLSAFGVHEDIAICIELTCGKDFDEDLRDILTTFLDNCAYGSR